jgi:hypothetical protein
MTRRRRRRPPRTHPAAPLAVAMAALVLATPQGRAVLTSDTRPTARPGGYTARPVAGVTCAMLPAGVLHQESGGDYSARGRPVGSHGGARALGGYQVMPANLPTWSREVLGHTVTERQFMASPALQDRIAGAKLRQSCAVNGPRGAAAEWFSGRPELANDYRYRGGGAASVGAYVDSAMLLARRYG